MSDNRFDTVVSLVACFVIVAAFLALKILYQ